MSDLSTLVSADLAQSVAERKAELMEAERKQYLSESFSGECDDWLQWSTDEEKDEALMAVADALRKNRGQPREDTLLQIALIVSNLIADAARGHAEQCVANGVIA